MIFTANLTIISHPTNSFDPNKRNQSVKYSKIIILFYFEALPLYVVNKLLYICSEKYLTLICVSF